MNRAARRRAIGVPPLVVTLFLLVESMSVLRAREVTDGEAERIIRSLSKGIEHRHHLMSSVDLFYTEERYFNKDAWREDRKNTFTQLRWLVEGQWYRAERRTLAREGEEPVREDHVIVTCEGGILVRYNPADMWARIEEVGTPTSGEAIAKSVASVADLAVPGQLGKRLEEMASTYRSVQRTTIRELDAWRVSSRSDGSVEAKWIAPGAGYLTVHAEGVKMLGTAEHVAKGWVTAVTATERFTDGAVVPKEKKTVWYVVEKGGRRVWTWLYKYRLTWGRVGGQRVLPYPVDLDWLPMGTRITGPGGTDFVGGAIEQELVDGIADGVGAVDVWEDAEVRLAR